MISRLRARLPLLDHVVRTVGRYQSDAGDRLAAGVTFYWFLSLFPVLLLAIALFRLVKGDAAVASVQSGLSGYLPGQLVDTIGNVIENSAGKAGIIGAVGLLLSGLGWIDALREAIRSVWHQNVQAGNIVTRKIADVIALAGLLVVVGASVAVTGVLGSGPSWLLSRAGLDDTPVAVAVTFVSGLLLAGLADMALFVYLFVRLARVPTPVRQVLKGAVFGAVGFAVLKLVGGYYVQRTTTKGEATYGTFAVVVGLLLFLNLVSRLILLAAAFTVTAPGDSDVRPSGTADPEQARKAGIPEEYVDTDLQEDGAPTPLVAALRADTEADPDEGDARSESDVPTGRARAAVAAPAAAAAGGEVAALPGATAVQRAAQGLAVLVGAGVLTVLVQALRNLPRVIRRAG